MQTTNKTIEYARMSGRAGAMRVPSLTFENLVVVAMSSEGVDQFAVWKPRGYGRRLVQSMRLTIEHRPLNTRSGTYVILLRCFVSVAAARPTASSSLSNR